MAKIIGNTTTTPIETYTKIEIDNKFGGVYRPCGSADTSTLPSVPQAGDVYNMKTIEYDMPGINEIFNSGNINVAIKEIFLQNKCVLVAHSEYDDYFMHLTDGKDAENKGMIVLSIDSGNPLFGVYKVEDVGDETGIAIYWTNDNVSWEKDYYSEEDNITTSYVEWGLPFNEGDNVVWTGHLWDKLSASIDTSNFATKEDIGNIETALDNIIAIQNDLIGGDSV